jgi:hypothetical protein
MFRDKNSRLRLAGRSADYQKLGIDPVEVAQFDALADFVMNVCGRQYGLGAFDAHLEAL